MKFDNQVISITGLLDDQGRFVAAMRFFDEYLCHVTHYIIEKDHGLVLCTATPAYAMSDEAKRRQNVYKLPYEMTDEALMAFCWYWLASPNADAIRGAQPDHDGSNEPGWQVYNEMWGHVGPHREALLAVLPIWAMFGK